MAFFFVCGFLAIHKVAPWGEKVSFWVQVALVPLLGWPKNPTLKALPSNEVRRHREIQR